ncbi:hypothetical protein FV226_26580 [Methylobacterium sp. WL12]|uniref:hypothetical protein n=1 Tax=Methylobacterium sp. WL12 TaxID=2603890 RepID=UPI0011C8A907|nr:hypothetical protein [Methylobacterium sp. WL12]TXM64409.1 hypothetical protein FV226_26580 [Methylobacterium sp. WL12]
MRNSSVAAAAPVVAALLALGLVAATGLSQRSDLPDWLAPRAYALGAAVGALLFGTILGLFGWLAAGRLRPRTGWRARIGFAFCGFLALWFAAALLGLGRTEGIGPWPGRAITGSEAGIAALLVLAAALPHALVVAFGRRARAAMA